MKNQIIEYLELTIEQVEKDIELEKTEYRIGKLYAYKESLTVVKKLSIYGVSGSFLDELIDKHKAKKKLALENCAKMKDSDQYPWYDATFNNELLFLFDLEDLKCRSGL